MKSFSHVTKDEIDVIKADSKMLEKFFKKNRSAIKSYAQKFRFYSPLYEEEDFEQEVMIGILKAMNSYKGESSSFSTYSYVIVKNHIFDLGRRRMKKVDRKIIDVALEDLHNSPQISKLDSRLTKIDNDVQVDFLKIFSKKDYNYIDLIFGHCLTINEVTRVLGKKYHQVYHYFHNTLMPKIKAVQNMKKISIEELSEELSDYYKGEIYG